MESQEGNASPMPVRENPSKASGRFRRILKNNWTMLILGVFTIILVTLVLLLLYSQLRSFQTVLFLSCVAYFPLTYLAYQLRSQKHKERIVDDFHLLGIIKRGEENLVEEWYQKIYSPQQYILFVSQASLVTLLGFGLLHFIPNLLSGLEISDTGAIVLTMFYSFLGAFVFSIFNVYRRFVTFDLQPGVYMYVVVMMVTVMSISFILAKLLDSTVKPAYLIPIVAFAIGYFPDIGMRWITSIAGRVAGRISRKETSLGNIEGISIWHETRLREAGIDNAQNLEACDVRELLLSSRFSAQQIMNWVDQAILIVNVSPPILRHLNKHSIRTITAFRALVDNVDFQNLPEIPTDLLVDDEGHTNVQGQVLPAANPAGQPLENRDEDQPRPGDIFRKNLRALYNAIYISADTSPNFHYVAQYWPAVRFFRTRQVETALQRTLQDRGILMVESLYYDPDMIERMGKAWTDLQLPSDALQTLFPNTVEGQVALGNLFVELDRYPDAMRAFANAISLNPDYAPTFASRGMAHAIRRAFADAYADFNKAKKLDPDYPVTYHHKGVALMKRGSYAEAIEEFNTAVNKDGTYALAYFNRGRARSYLRDFDNAQEDFSQAIQLKKMSKAYFERGTIYMRKAMIRLAIDDFGQVIKLDRFNARAYANRGQAYLAFGDENRALYDFDTAIELNPKLAIAYAYRGSLFLKWEYEDSAAEDFSKALELDPSQASNYYLRGLAYLGLDELPKAIDDFRKYIELAPEGADLSEAMRLLADLEEQIQNTTES